MGGIINLGGTIFWGVNNFVVSKNMFVCVYHMEAEYSEHFRVRKARIYEAQDPEI